MSQVLPTPRVDLVTRGDCPELVLDVVLVEHEGKGGEKVLATFTDYDEAEAFADARHRELREA